MIEYTDSKNMKTEEHSKLVTGNVCNIMYFQREAKILQIILSVTGRVAVLEWM